MRVFFDNCTSPVLAETINGYLRHLKDSATHIRDLPCGRHAGDFEWMAYLASTGDDWLVVSGDGRIHKKKAERAAFRQAGLKGLVLAPSYQKTPIFQQASFLMWRWPEVMDLLRVWPEKGWVALAKCAGLVVASDEEITPWFGPRPPGSSMRGVCRAMQAI